jgi:glutaminyl-tRNA synthetase
MSPEISAPAPNRDFIREMVADDAATNRFGRQIATRFPPEPNGFPHIGHVKAIALNFGIAREFGGRCNLRFDDTNPLTEDIKYVEAIKNDIRWLGFEWDAELYASDYFDQLYAFAELLISRGKAYVDSQDDEQIKATRGTVMEPGTMSPYRDRSIEENLDLLRRMKAGEFPDGAHVLRAKIDMAHPNMLMRDPLLLRIRHAHHYRQGDAWCLYPFYDFAHPLSDAIEGITHSLCSLEFKDNNDIYRWLVRECGFDHPPEQTEFSRLNLEYTVMSKRILLRLVNDGIVSGWDDPRMPTVAGMRRRGCTPEGLRAFVEAAGVSRKPQRTELATFEHAIRNDLNMRVPRVMCVVNPLKVVIENYPEGQVEELEASYYPHDVPKTGSRSIPFSRELYVERDDFMENPPKKFYRLAPGREVRLRYGYFITCTSVVKNDAGEITELRCTYDPATRGGDSPDGRKVQGTIHWVSAAQSLDCELRVYDKLFSVAEPEVAGEGVDFVSLVNPESLVVVRGAKVEPSVGGDAIGTRYQFERTGYFISDPIDSRDGRLVFNRTVTLRDTWAKIRSHPERA